MLNVHESAQAMAMSMHAMCMVDVCHVHPHVSHVFAPVMGNGEPSSIVSFGGGRFCTCDKGLHSY